MRPIEFRVWNGKKMLYEGDKELDHVALTFDGRLVTPNDSDLCLFEDAFGTWKLMQYTGLKDKNGKEIYEWDIISIPSTFAEVQGVVGWNEKKAGWGINTSEMKDATIIGNIYENPELLNV